MSGLDTDQFASDDPGAGQGSRGDSRRGRRQAVPWFGTLGQLDFDIDFYERLLARKTDSLDVLRILAELVSRKGDLRRAVDLDRRLVELLPEDFLARYNLACSLARAGRPDEAIARSPARSSWATTTWPTWRAIPIWRASTTTPISRRSWASDGS